MKGIALVTLLSLHVFPLPAVAQIPPREAVKSSNNPARETQDKAVPGYIVNTQRIPFVQPVPPAAIMLPVPPEAAVIPEGKVAQGTKVVKDYLVTQPWSKDLVLVLSLSILCFGFLVLLLMAYLVIKGKNADQILRVCALPLIIVAAIFLVVTGYTSDQIAPVMGLLGAIAGYILGSKRAEEPSSTRSDQPSSNT